MENNSKPFFDPYILNTQLNQNQPNYISNQFNQENTPSLEELKNAASAIPSATKYYEEQFIYYRYLSQVVDYKTRLFEYEKLTKQQTSPNIRTNISQK